MSGMTRSRERAVKICPQCSTSFSVANYRKDSAVYCSRRCMALSSRSEVKAVCEECGNAFTHISSRANKAKYCCKTCYYKAMSRKGSVVHACEHCSTEFRAPPSHKRRYCSRACINKAKKEAWSPTFTTARREMIKRGLVLKCERCGYDEEPKILGVHHKDRNRKNNEISNLEVLCPTCHSLEHVRHIPQGFRE